MADLSRSDRGAWGFEPLPPYMAAQLDDFVDTKHLLVDGECKKLKNWVYQNDEYCAIEDCTPSMVLIFEDGTRVKRSQIESLSNC